MAANRISRAVPVWVGEQVQVRKSAVQVTKETGEGVKAAFQEAAF